MVTSGRKVSTDALFIVRVAQMNIKSSWRKKYRGCEPNQILYEDYQNKSDYELVEFLDGLHVQRY
jgi:hypothetical protein